MHKSSVTSLFDINNIIHLKECSSTNDYLISLNKKSNCKEGTIVGTDFQSKGRGQRTNLWFSEKKSNLTFSIIIEPFLPISYQFYLNIISSLSIYNVLKSILGEDIKIKWPNDIFYQDKKIAGILVENIVKNKKIQKSIIGIGLNVNQKKFPISEAISIANIISVKYKRKKLFNFILIELEKNYNFLKNKNFETLLGSYSLGLYKLNENISFIETKKILVLLKESLNLEN